MTHDSRNAFGCHADRFPLLAGLSVTPEVDNSVSYRHAQIVGMSPGLLLQFVKQLLSNGRIGKGHFELWPGAGDHLDQVTPADDADEIAVLVNDRNTLDPALLKQCRDFMQWRFRGRRYDVGGHNVFNSSRMRFGVIGRHRRITSEKMCPPGVGPLGPGFRAMDQIAFSHDADDLAGIVDNGNCTYAFLKQDRSRRPGRSRFCLR